MLCVTAHAGHVGHHGIYPHLMIAIDQFKDVRALRRAPARRYRQRARRWLVVGVDETLGSPIGRKVGPQRGQREACDPEIVARYA